MRRACAAAPCPHIWLGMRSAGAALTHSGITKHYALEVVTNLYKFLPGGAALQKAKLVGQKMNLIAETPVTPRCRLCRPPLACRAYPRAQVRTS